MFFFFYLRREKFDTMAVDFEIYAYISTFIIYMCWDKKRVGYKIEGYLHEPTIHYCGCIQ